MKDEITWKIAALSLLCSTVGGLIGGLPSVIAHEEQKAKQVEYKDTSCNQETAQSDNQTNKGKK